MATVEMAVPPAIVAGELSVDKLLARERRVENISATAIKIRILQLYNIISVRIFGHRRLAIK